MLDRRCESFIDYETLHKALQNLKQQPYEKELIAREFTGYFQQVHAEKTDRRVRTQPQGFAKTRQKQRSSGCGIEGGDRSTPSKGSEGNQA